MTTTTNRYIMPDPEVRRFQMECYARVVIAEGYGARSPVNVGSEANPYYPTLQERGRQLFGTEAFNEVLDREIRKRKTAADAGGGHHDATLQPGEDPSRSTD
jgi:hypothetical protein